ncbi:MAG TPA: hypothetical protein VF103_06510 [Polyangiaceae bacterium]
MPTNKLWIEHTERAAWQSVQALREKLTEAEQRAERLAPPAQGWRELLDALDQARDRHTLAGETYAELVRSLLDWLARAESERRALASRATADPAPVRLEPPPARPRKRSEDDDWDEDDEGSEQKRRSERRFFEEIRKRSHDLEKERPRPDPGAVLGELETRLADLPDLDPGEISDIATDLAALALMLGPSRRGTDE